MLSEVQVHRQFTAETNVPPQVILSTSESGGR